MKRFLTITALISTVAVLGGCAGSRPSDQGLPPGGGTGGENRTLTVAWGSDFVFMTTDQAKQYWTDLSDEMHQKFPNVTVNLVPIAGGYNDITNKLSLLYRSPDTAPDIGEIPAGEMGPFVSAGYLRPVDGYLRGMDWWDSFPENVKNETRFDGKYYGVNQGQNTEGLWYNQEIFKKAGIALPWQPKNWDDVLNTAKKIKASVPEVAPMWLSGGTAGGTIGIEYNAGSLLAGSTDPTIRDPHSGKWVVDSPGLRETFKFYQDLGQNGLNAPAAQLLDPNAIVSLPATLKQQNIACPWPWKSPRWWPCEVPAGGQVKVPTLCSCRP